MQVLCVATTDDKDAPYDVQCAGCGQRYRVYYSRRGKTECEEALQAVRVALAEHHVRALVTEAQAVGQLGAHSEAHSAGHAGAHPGDAFNVPAWHGPAYASGAALLSGAPLVPQPRTRTGLTLVPNPSQRRVS